MKYKDLSTILVILATLASPLAGQAPPPTPVTVEEARIRELTPTTSLLGTTEPRRRSLVAASIEGYVIDYPVDEGQRVEKGDVITLLRDNILKLELDREKALLEEIQETHRQAKLDLERARKLIEEDAVTQKTLDDAITRERTQSLKIIQARARIEVLDANIAKKRITAPFAGQIVREHTEIGEWVERGAPVATLVDITSIFIRVHVPERSIRHVQKGSRVQVQIDAASEKPVEGVVVSVSDEGDPVARTFPVRVEISGREGLRAGMSARVEIPTATARSALVIPKDACLLEGTRRHVFVIGPDSVATRVPVEIGASTGNSYEVTSGLEAGARVVIRGNERLRSGMPVRVLPPGPAPGAPR